MPSPPLTTATVRSVSDFTLGNQTMRDVSYLMDAGRVVSGEVRLKRDEGPSGALARPDWRTQPNFITLCSVENAEAEVADSADTGPGPVLVLRR